MGGGKGSNTTSSTFKPPQEFMDAYKEALGMARTATGQPYQQYQGPLVAGLSQTQQQGIANVNAAQGMALPAIQRGMQYTTEAAQGITPELYAKFYSPYVKDVAQSTFANLMESQAQQQSGLKGSAIQAGAFGGDRSGVASAEMARQQQLANAMAMSNIYNQGYGQAMGLAGQQVANLGSMGQQLAGLGAGAQGSVLQGAQAQMAAGAQEQATEQARLQAAYDQWMQRQAYPFQQAQFFANVAQGLGAGAGGSSSTTAPAPSFGSQILGGLGAIGSIYSDKRMKENIQAVGKLNDGQTVYRYNFKGDPKTQIGLLAQEVEESKPGAVTQVRGLKMVDYKGATEDAAEMSSMGGVVSPSADRQGLAGGGIPYYPYGGALGYIPEGKISGQSDTIGYRAPKPYEDEGLGKDWLNIMPLSKEQAGGLRKMASDMGLDLPGIKPTSAETEDSEEEDDYGLGLRGLFQKGISYLRSADGGVVGRRGYEDGGVSTDEEEGLASVPEPDVEVVDSKSGVAPASPPEAEDSEGVAAAEATPGSYVIPGEDQPSGLGKIFDIRKAFASEENPSIIERVMGRRLSPEARAAMLNASFALMAGRSPFFFTNLGEAGRVGAQTYYNAIDQSQQLKKQKEDAARQMYEAQTSRAVADLAREKAILERKEKEEQKKLIESAILQLPIDQQAAARLAPEEFFGEQAKGIFKTNNIEFGLGTVPLEDDQGNFAGYGQMSSSGGLYYNGMPIDQTGLRAMDPAKVAQSRAGGTLSGKAPEVVVEEYIKKTRPEMIGIGETFSSLNQARSYLERGIETGSLSEQIQALRSLGARFGFNVDESVLSNTQAYQNFIGSIVIPRMAQLGGNDSNEELKKLYSLSGGDITQSLTALKDTLNFMENLMVRKFNTLKGTEEVALKYLPGLNPIEIGEIQEEELPDLSNMTDEQLEKIINGQ